MTVCRIKGNFAAVYVPNSIGVKKQKVRETKEMIYYVDTEGNVWSKRKKNGTMNLLKLSKDRKGEPTVFLGYGCHRSLKVLIARAFFTEIPGLISPNRVGHINGIRQDCRAENLYVILEEI
jgi:hypothetical protein